jgi:hypothetical protein
MESMIGSRGVRIAFVAALALLLPACSNGNALGDSGLILVDLGSPFDYDAGFILRDGGTRPDTGSFDLDADEPSPDAAQDDTGVIDTGAATDASDAGTADTGPLDTGLDAGPDSGPPDSGIHPDATLPDAAAPDATAADATSADTGATDASSGDGGPTCDIIIDSTPCSMCVETFCCPQLDACVADPTCSMELTGCYAQCIEAHVVSVCLNMCFMSPVGIAGKTCVLTNCSSFCP